MIIAGCSKEVPHDPNMESWVNDLSLPVPIEIGSSGFQFETKADMIDKVEDLANYPLRLFAVDKNSSLSVEQTASKSTLFANELAYYSVESERIVFGEKGSDQVWYYPYASSANYTFYAYHVESGDSAPLVEKPQSSDEALFTLVDLNEQQSDILWAESVADIFYPSGEDNGNGLDGFNAKYMRAIASSSDKDKYMPCLNFRHVTTAVTFNFKIEKESAEDQDQYQYEGVKVNSLTLTNIPRYVNFWIADNTSNRKGTLTVSGRKPFEPVVLNCENVEMEDVGNLTNLGTLFIMVPPDEQAIVAEMKISVPLSNDTIDEVPATLNLKNSNGFKPGFKYSYDITMKSPKLITIKATVNPWNEDTEGTDQSYVGDAVGGGLIIE